MKNVSKICLAVGLFHQLAVTSPVESRDTDCFIVGQGVNTSSGFVLGSPAPQSPDVSQYLGIPFAIPPVGNLRWKASQPYISHGIINGSSFVGVIHLGLNGLTRRNAYLTF